MTRPGPERYWPASEPGSSTCCRPRPGNRRRPSWATKWDDADRRNAEQSGVAVDQLLRARWAALVRTEARHAAGSYGRSVASGQAIPDERLEADPLAELTVEEAAAAERGAVEEGENAVGLASAAHPFEVLADEDITPEEEQASEEDDDEPPPEPDPGIHIEPYNQAR
jgi:RNA polymerase-binding transcription factor DksA